MYGDTSATVVAVVIFISSDVRKKGGTVGIYLILDLNKSNNAIFEFKILIWEFTIHSDVFIIQLFRFKCHIQNFKEFKFNP